MTSALPLIFRLLMLACLLLPLAGPPLAHATTEPPLANVHHPEVGQPFFLLSDATYTSRERPQVRLEINSVESLENVGGVDVLVYRLNQPLEFLRQQRNLHRIKLPNAPMPEGVANSLTHTWDSWVAKSRRAWRQWFSPEAKAAVVQAEPAFKTPRQLGEPSRFEEGRQFRPLPGLPVVDQFRYPVHLARPIAVQPDLALPGSSSDFIPPALGNVMIPLATQRPGLYLVEAIVGQHRATTLLFVSDTLALTKVSSGQMLVWTVQRHNGAAVAGTQVVWTDGVGVLKTGRSDARGLVELDRPAPEHTYVFGQDPDGGVFISENFYGDSEIYSTKLYAVTDRPLYRPGDEVKVKVSGREFTSALQSVPLADGDLALSVQDPNGQTVLSQTVKFSASSGADTQLRLPTNAPAGGYELRLVLRGDTYLAAFRVADYQKPHFEIVWLPDKPEFSTGEAVGGRVQLSYPDGKPVAGARLELKARALPLSMLEGELGEAGAMLLPDAKIDAHTDAQGMARYVLPAAERPSRYLLSVLATDGAAYRVRGSRELLVERGAALWRMVAMPRFSTPGQALDIQWSLGTGADDNPSARPVRWEWLRLEDRRQGSGTLPGAPAGQGRFSLSLPQPGHYTLMLRDARGRMVGATSHWVSGEGVKAPAGSIQMVFNQARYQPGDTAEVLITFPEPVQQALLTLERERVDTAVLLTEGGKGLRTQRLGPTQWKVSLPVTEQMSPNITFSVASVVQGQALFDNQGLSVAWPRIAVELTADKTVYAPGDTVTVTLTTRLAGQPVAAEVAVGVVDEMIYVLQPEIAPSIETFFYHPRRNNVRTSQSLSFIGYDLATQALGQLPGQGPTPQRSTKVQERPRRDQVDTAAWLPRLRTDATGHTRFSFVMPDALTRWRITGRAMDANGRVGQHHTWVRSDKALYAKWVSPQWQRLGDKVQASVALFNQHSSDRKVEWAVNGPGVSLRDAVTLRPGANFVKLPLAADQVGERELSLSLIADGRVVDSLKVPLAQRAAGWSGPREHRLTLNASPAALNLPADASGVQVTLATDPAAGAFSRWMDELVDYPFGCVEQTASRMLPLTLALGVANNNASAPAQALTQRLSSARLALRQMAGPKARFGWWGRQMQEDAFLTAYAYYADWRATQALRTPLPATHWQQLLGLYAEHGQQLAPMQQALMLHWMQEMGLQVRSQVGALLDQLATAPGNASASPPSPAGLRSRVMTEEPGTEANDMAWVLAVMSASTRATPAQRAQAQAAAARLASSRSVLAQSLLALTQPGGAAQASRLLEQLRGDQPTFDRAQALLWLHRALGGLPAVPSVATSLPAPWVAQLQPSGQTLWQLPAGQPLPSSLSFSGPAKLAFVRYDSADNPPSASLPVQIERRLYRVHILPPPPSTPDDTPSPGHTTLRLEPVAPGSPLDSHALYLDELRVRAERRMRWTLLEVALPPGASVEASTWGLNLLAKDGKPQPLETARHQSTAQGYALPLDVLEPGSPHTVRHLLRFAQQGSYRLPPARLYRMYEPEAKAQESGGRWSRLDVR